MRLFSRGYVDARSNRPGDRPAMNPRYLSEEADRRAIIGGLRLGRRIFSVPVSPRREPARTSTFGPTTNCAAQRRHLPSLELN